VPCGVEFDVLVLLALDCRQAFCERCDPLLKLAGLCAPFFHLLHDPLQDFAGVLHESPDIVPYEILQPQSVEPRTSPAPHVRVESSRRCGRACVFEVIAAILFAREAAVVPIAFSAPDKTSKEVFTNGVASGVAFVILQAGYGDLLQLPGDYDRHFTLYLAGRGVYYVGAGICPAPRDAADRHGGPGRAVLARAAAVLLTRRRDAFQVQTLRLRKKCSAPAMLRMMSRTTTASSSTTTKDPSSPTSKP